MTLFLMADTRKPEIRNPVASAAAQVNFFCALIERRKKISRQAQDGLDKQKFPGLNSEQ